MFHVKKHNQEVRANNKRFKVVLNAKGLHDAHTIELLFPAAGMGEI